MSEMLRFKSDLDDSAFTAGLRRMATGVAGVATGIGGALAGIATAGDQATQSISRINAATGNLDSARDVYARLRDVASDTGLAIGDAAGQFSRFSIAARQIGATNDQVVQLIDTIAKAGVVSGSTAQEAAAAGQQIGQGLASGRLNGEELNSLMENMPLLAEQLAKQLGVGIGELRKMGEEGQLTADVAFPALLASADAINAKFTEIPKSMERGWSGVINEGSAFLAQLDQATGLSRSLVTVLEEASNVIKGMGGEMARPQSFIGRIQRNYQWGLEELMGVGHDPEAPAESAQTESKATSSNFQATMKLRQEEEERASLQEKINEFKLRELERTWDEEAATKRLKEIEEDRLKIAQDRAIAEGESLEAKLGQEAADKEKSTLSRDVEGVARGVRALTRENPAEIRRAQRAADAERRRFGSDVVDPETGEKISDADADRLNEQKRRENDFKRLKGTYNEERDKVIERDADPREQAADELGKYAQGRAKKDTVTIDPAGAQLIAQEIVKATKDMVPK